MRSALVLLSCFMLFGCGDNAGDSAIVTDQDAAAPAPPPVASSLYQAAQRASNTRCVASDYPPGLDTRLTLELAYPELPELGSLMGLSVIPDLTGDWLAFSKEGAIWRFANEPQVDAAKLVLDLREAVEDQGELGLLGLALHPDFSSNGYLYLYYSPSKEETRITRLHWSTEFEQFEAGSEKVLLTIAQPRTIHNGGTLAFGPDGLLYLSVGDGGGRYDEFGNSQDTGNLRGAIVRIDVDSEYPYGIPQGNPFADAGVGRPEIYAYGSRNAWRMSFDRLTGELWAADVGQQGWEEVNKVDAGDNHGWPVMEGSQCVAAGCDDSSYEPPAYAYPHEKGECAIIGGYVYRGAALTDLYGQYLYADYCSGNVHGVSGLGTAFAQSALLTPSSLAISAFAEDAAGELYVVSLGGGAGAGVYRLVEDRLSTAQASEKLSEQPCFTSLAPLELAGGVFEYELAAPLWSDGAGKERYFAIPDSERIALTEQGDLSFPVGSVLIKNFFVAERILETRLLQHHLTGWRGYSYAWNEDQTEAILQPQGGETLVDGELYYYPNQGECLECHTAAADFVLGPDAYQLLGVAQAGETALEAMQRLALLSSFELMLPLSEQPRTYAIDSDASVADRARSYLHSNCSGCHQPNAAAGFMDLRRQTSFAETGLCNVEPSEGDLGIEGARRLVPADPDKSVLLLRMMDRGEHAMPPLATKVVDVAAVAVIREWIEGLSNCDQP